MLEGAAARAVPVMLFVPSDGVLQIRSGLVKTVRVIDGWLNVLDPGFNLHVLHASVTQAWRVRKPSRGGTVTSLELYDVQGRNVLLAFGERDEGAPERESWRQLVESLARLPD
jgi:putative hemin transport protein